MIGVTSSSEVAITSTVNFPFLLIFNFKCTTFFFNIFNTEVNVVLAKISMCIFLNLGVILLYQLVFISPLEMKLFPTVSWFSLLSNWLVLFFLKKYCLRLPYLSQVSVCELCGGEKLLENYQNLLENSWNLSRKNEWPPCPHLGFFLVLRIIFQIINFWTF